MDKNQFAKYVRDRLCPICDSETTEAASDSWEMEDRLYQPLACEQGHFMEVCYQIVGVSIGGAFLTAEGGKVCQQKTQGS